MEDEDFRIMKYYDRTFKCFRDGQVFVWGRQNQHCPFSWKKCENIFKVNHTSYFVFQLGAHKRVLLHRLLGKSFLGLDINDLSQVIDHIDGNGMNNNFENLRVVTQTMNNRNRKGNISGVYQSGKQYMARIGKREYKYFKTKEEALAWRQAKEIELGYFTRAKGI
jgi:viroplasmin and RNaseH domain-containing protein